MELFTNEGISHIASAIGISLFMDKAIELRNRLSFARACLEISQESPLPSYIHVEIEDFGSIEIDVEYPWKPLIRSLCKEIGHTGRGCKNFKRVWRPTAKDVLSKESAFVHADEIHHDVE